jgi:hypothetical protein
MKHEGKRHPTFGVTLAATACFIGTSDAFLTSRDKSTLTFSAPPQDYDRGIKHE